MADQLGPDDYKMLYGMITSDDEGQRKQAQSLSSKLTPDEAKQFFDFQHLAHGPNPELHREDNSFLGAPPELAAAAGVGVGAGIVKAGVNAAATGASRAVAAGKAAVSMAAPAVKYEATKSILEKFGVPGPLATVAAMGVAGYSGPTKAASATPIPSVSPSKILPKNTDLGSMFGIQMDAPAAAATAVAPKMSLSAIDVGKIKDMIASGIPQGEAVRRVWNLKVQNP